MLSVTQRRGLASLIFVAPARAKRTVARVLADARLIAVLFERDGVQSRRPNTHGSSETCPYNAVYANGDCPWCHQAASRSPDARLRLRRRRAA